MRLALLALLAALLTSAPALAQGGPPVITDDAGTPGDGRWEINVAAALERRAGGAYAMQLPLLDLNYGLGDAWQLKYETSFQLTRSHGERTAKLLGNSNLGVKWRFLDQEQAGVSVSVYPQLIFNPVTSGAIGLVDRDEVLLLPVEVHHAFERLRVAAEVGYAVGFGGADAWVYGVVAGHPVGRVLVVADLHGDADVRFLSDELFLLIGAVAPTDSTAQLLVSVGRSVRHARSDGPATLAFLGLRLNL